MTDTIAALSERGVPVCAHLGLTPQFVNKFGGYKVQGRDEHAAELAKLREERSRRQLHNEEVRLRLESGLEAPQR